LRQWCCCFSTSFSSVLASALRGNITISGFLKCSSKIGVELPHVRPVSWPLTKGVATASCCPANSSCQLLLPLLVLDC
jgi:hypothetical protein